SSTRTVFPFTRGSPNLWTISKPRRPTKRLSPCSSVGTNGILWIQPPQTPRAAEARASIEPGEGRTLDRAERADIATESAAETSVAAAAPIPGDPDGDALARARWRASELEAAAAWVGVEPRRIPELPLLAVEVGELEGERLARLRQRLPGGEVLEIATAARTTRQREGEEKAGGAEAAGDAPGEAAGLDRDETAEAAPMLTTGWRPSGEARIRIAAPVAADSLAALLLRLAAPPAQP
ncbi:MAG: hypothetical protein R3266_08265, partial [Gemmatimonadota bacterium]|nr:hypothetical protein [Gemmatimonadota bacterium]